MDRWRHRATLTLALTALGVGGCSDSDSGEREKLPAAKKGSPNIVVVLTDDQDVASLEFMPYVSEELAAEGTEFSSAFVTTPLCCPSRASILTGRYAHNHGVLSNEPPDGGFTEFDDSETLPVWLQNVGYRTGYIGKYLNGYGWLALGNEPTYVPPGWSSWIALANHTEYQMYGYDLNFDGEVRSYGDKAGAYQTDVIADEADAFIRDNAGRRPFFLTVATTAPHDEGILDDVDDAPRNPRPAPRDLGTYDDVELPQSPSYDESDVSDKPEYVQNERRLDAETTDEYETLYRSRAESMLAVDAMVERLRRTLVQAGEAEDTVFVFTSDNGFVIGEHRLKGKNVPYPEATQVPLVISGPGFEVGARREGLAANIDLVPTLLELAGGEATTPVDGVSLLDPVDPERELLIEGWSEDGDFTSLQTPDHIYTEYTSGERELYDLRADPHELDNLADEPATSDLLEELGRRLEALRDCSGDGCRPGEK